MTILIHYDQIIGLELLFIFCALHDMKYLCSIWEGKDFAIMIQMNETALLMGRELAQAIPEAPLFSDQPYIKWDINGVLMIVLGPHHQTI